MAGKTYVGNSSNVPVQPKKIYVGNSGAPALVKEIYVGNSNNQPVKVWPNIIIPDTNYQQIEYLGLSTNGPGDLGINTGVKLRVSNPRIVAKFMITNVYLGNWNPPSIFDSQNYGTTTVVEGFHTGFYQHVQTNAFAVVFGNASGQSWGSSQTDPTYGVNPSNVKNTLSSMEGILTNVPYIIDFDNRSNGYSRFYLYASEGYYSLPAHNLLWNIKTPTFNPSNWYEETPYYIRFDSSLRTRFYSFKMYNTSGSLIRNFYPCYKKTDNILGFYDIANRVFYSTNLTTDSGKMDYGPDYVGEL